MLACASPMTVVICFSMPKRSSHTIFRADGNKRPPLAASLAQAHVDTPFGLVEKVLDIGNT